MKRFLYMLFMVGCSFAINTTYNITAGSCLTDIVSNDTYCAENATIVYNVTNVTNVTTVTCNATNTTLWANSSITINNQTVECFTNTTIVYQNQTVYVNVTQNVSTPIPANYCYENILINPMSYQQVFRNDRCNITAIAPPNASQSICPAPVTCLPYQYYTPCQTCEVCAACETCEVCQECAPPRVCQTAEELCGEAVSKINSTIFGEGGYVMQLAAKDEIIKTQRDTLVTIDGKIEKEVDEKTGNVNDMYAYALIAGIGCISFFIWKSRQPDVKTLSGVSEAITKERLDNLRKQREEKT